MNQDTALLAGVVADVVDGLLLGLPSTVVLSKVRQKAQVDSAKLMMLIEQINDRINQLQNAKMREDEIRADLKAQMYSANPMGALYKALSDEVSRLSHSGTAEKLDKASAELLRAEAGLDKAREAQTGGFSWHLNKQGSTTNILSGEY